MKVSIASATLCGLLAANLFAAEPNEADPAPPEKTAPARKAKPAKPRILKQPTPQTAARPSQAAPGTAPRSLPDANQPVYPSAAPRLSFAPGAGEEAGPPITLHPGTTSLAPGIYVASPFTGIVVVPEPTDPKMVKGLPRTREVMPAPTPELRLAPKAK